MGHRGRGGNGDFSEQSMVQKTFVLEYEGHVAGLWWEEADVAMDGQCVVYRVLEQVPAF